MPRSRRHNVIIANVNQECLFATMPDFSLDTSGLRCPMPLLKTKLELNAMETGQELEVIATDPGSARDIPAFVKLTSHVLVSTSESDGCYRFLIRRGQ
jgi:TusA-related sulfurtransferase